jgi:hypothetical protein
MFWKPEGRKEFSTHTVIADVENDLRDIEAKNGLERANNMEDWRTSVLRKARAVTGPQG